MEAVEAVAVEAVAAAAVQPMSAAAADILAVGAAAVVGVEAAAVAAARPFSCNHSYENDEFIPPSEIGELGTPHRVRTSPSATNPTGFPVGPFYFLPHQSKMPPMCPQCRAFFCFASRLS